VGQVSRNGAATATGKAENKKGMTRESEPCLFVEMNRT
jgi:hypothetical protein